MSYFFPIIQLIAAIVGVLNYKKLVFYREKYFLLLLWYTFIVEAVNLILNTCFLINLEWWHGIYSVISFLFYFYWYYNVLEKKLVKRIVVFFIVLFTSITLLTYIFPKELSNQGYSFITGAISLLVLTFFHFYQLLSSNEILVVKNKLSFWVSTGLLLFYMGIIPLILLSKYLVIEGMSKTIILLSLNIILYGCYIIGFLWAKKR